MNPPHLPTLTPPRSASAASADSETRFDRNVWLLLLGALLFVALDLAQLAYRFTLPTEGWVIESDENAPDDYTFHLLKNVVGAPSPLEPGDAMTLVGGIPAERILNSTQLSTPPPAGWVAGGQIRVSVIRGGKTLSFDIPVVHWTFAAWLSSNFADARSLVLWWAAALIMFGVGLLTMLKRPGNLAGRFLFLFGLALFSSTLASSLPDGLGVYFNWAAIAGAALFRNVIFPYLFAPALLGFGLTFPRPKAFVGRRPWLLSLPFVLGSSGPVLLFIDPAAAAIGFPITLAMVLATISALIHSALTMRDAISRAQLRWAVGGVVLGLGLFTLNFVPLAPGNNPVLLLPALGLPVMGLSLMIAILRYRLFDIDLIIRRTLAYSLLTVLLALVYFGGVTLLQRLFTAATGQSSPAALVISTVLIAALFSPLRKRVQDFIDRRFYRKKFDSDQALNQFALAARSETEIGRLSDKMLQVANEALQPQFSNVWLAQTESESSERSDS